MSEAPESGQDTAALDGGSYEVIRRRLLDQGKHLGQKLDTLNGRRKQTFGSTELVVLANERIRTANNCVPRDIVNVRGKLLLGFEVFLGLRQDTSVSDVFSAHRFAEAEDGTYDLSELPVSTDAPYLEEPGFVKEFTDLFRYYRETKLRRLQITDTRLLAIFKVGAALGDIKVFRFSIDPSGKLAYIDSRGDRDYVIPAAHDFEWTQTTREDQRAGRFPHVSIMDIVFVETTGGDFTIKIENNTESGEGIFADLVDDPNQSVDDAEIYYAKLGTLLLLKVKPFREEAFRYYVYDIRTESAMRIDAIGLACRQLPEDHGIIFPGGYVLASGEHKVFPENVDGLEFERAIKSPNGEDVLYVFHRRVDGLYALLPYNLIRKEVATPIICHGMSLFPDGRLLVFRSTTEEPSRIHPMQIWKTPFTSAEFAAAAPTDGSFLAKVGNADLVRGISDAYAIKRLAEHGSPSRRTFEDLIAGCQRVIDAYYWVGHEETLDLRSTLVELRKTAELVVDEFEKVLAMRARAVESLTAAKKAQDELFGRTRPEDLTGIEAYVGALAGLRTQRGKLVSLREIRYVDLAVVEGLEKAVVEQTERVSKGTIAFLLGPAALVPLIERIDTTAEEVEKLARVVEAKEVGKKLDEVNDGLTLLSEIVTGLAVDDATERASILESISEVFARQNRVRATLENKRKALAATEGRAEFGSQVKLIAQNVASAVARSATPDACDAELSRLLVALEELEGRFGDVSEFIEEISGKREEIYEAFGAKRQQLVDERQRRAEALRSAANRILEGVGRRARSFSSIDDMNAYFASDAMIEKLRQTVVQLRELGDSVRADEVESRIKAANQDAIRALRDKLDLFDEGEGTVRFGRYQFSFNREPLELTMVPREGEMYLHLTGTDFYERVDDEAFQASRPFWGQELPSEDETVARAEFLAASMLFDADEGKSGLSIEGLLDAQRSDAGLAERVRAYAQDRYDEGYERGVHDHDATLILDRLLLLRGSAGLLRYPSQARVAATLFFAFGLEPDRKARIARHAQSVGRIAVAYGGTRERNVLAGELGQAIATFVKTLGIALSEGDTRLAGLYLVDELAKEHPSFETSADAERLRDVLFAQLDVHGTRRAFDEDQKALEHALAERVRVVDAWMEGAARAEPSLAHAVTEASAIVLTDRKLDRHVSQALVAAEVTGLLGAHARIKSGTLHIALDEMLARLSAFVHDRLPRYRAYRKLRHEVLERERARLRVEELKPKPMTSFVRNRLIDEVYLHLVGANLAKQIGATGAGKRTDLMGLLLLVSPPGYGKTTLMEYVASRLGLVFVKVNGPALGHSVTSLDPAEATNATARQEVEKIGLAFEMGNNVMLYLDDIQHTSPELLQKFISLCDGQRKIEGVYRGRSRTYDLRGKKFCVVMAGNPYTETGEKFRIPDMLANRADTYNLGEILEGKDDVFALSYVENALTSNPALAPLAMRDPKDVHIVLRMAAGEQIPSTELSYAYSPAELSEMIAVFTRMFRARDVLLMVNAQYIASASQEEAYRTEPPFKLQGSYRNMNKLAEKVVAVMNDDEVERLIDDHYQGESQTLTTGAEQNLLKLAEMRGRITPEQKARWDEIKREMVRIRTMGGGTDDPVTRVTGSLTMLGRELESIRTAIGDAVSGGGNDVERNRSMAEQVDKLVGALANVSKGDVSVTVSPPKAFDDVLRRQTELVDQILVPLVQSAARNLEDARSLHAHVISLLELLRKVDSKLRDMGEAEG